MVQMQAARQWMVKSLASPLLPPRLQGYVVVQPVHGGAVQVSLTRWLLRQATRRSRMPSVLKQAREK